MKATHSRTRNHETVKPFVRHGILFTKIWKYNCNVCWICPFDWRKKRWKHKQLFTAFKNLLLHSINNHKQYGYRLIFMDLLSFGILTVACLLYHQLFTWHRPCVWFIAFYRSMMENLVDPMSISWFLFTNCNATLLVLINIFINHFVRLLRTTA